MPSSSKIAIVDPVARRRAQISYFLNPVVAHVEPCESVADLRRLNLEALDFVFVCDIDGAIEDANLAALEAGDFSVIAYHEHPVQNRIVAAMRAGTADYLQWPFQHDHIVQGIVGAKGYRTTMSRLRSRQMRAMRRMETLSPREREILTLVCDGQSSKEAARSLGLSPRTVDIHRANMLTKLHARNTSEAVRIALEGSLFCPEAVGPSVAHGALA